MHYLFHVYYGSSVILNMSLSLFNIVLMGFEVVVSRDSETAFDRDFQNYGALVFIRKCLIQAIFCSNPTDGFCLGLCSKLIEKHKRIMC